MNIFISLGLSIGIWIDEFIKWKKVLCCFVGVFDGNVGIVWVVNGYNII